MRGDFDTKKIKEPISLFKTSKPQTSVTHRKIIAVISMVPRGAVATYGQIARLAECPGHVRQVVCALHSSSKKYKLPWHRIINAQGRIGHTDEHYRMRQKMLLGGEGIEFDSSGKIDLGQFLWSPKIPHLRKILKKVIEDPVGV